MSFQDLASLSANLLAVIATIVSLAAWLLSRRTVAKFRRPLWVTGLDPMMVKTVATKLRAAGYKSVSVKQYYAPMDPRSLPVLAMPDKSDAMEWWNRNGQPEYGVVYCPGRTTKPDDWIASNSIPISLPLWVSAAVEARWPQKG